MPKGTFCHYSQQGAVCREGACVDLEALLTSFEEVTQAALKHDKLGFLEQCRLWLGLSVTNFNTMQLVHKHYISCLSLVSLHGYHGGGSARAHNGVLRYVVHPV